MANLLSLLNYALIDADRQRHLDQMQRFRHESAAYNMLRPAITMQGGATVNEIKGTTLFAVANASRGKGTAVWPRGALGGVTVYHATTPAPAAPRRRRGRARK